MKIMKIISAMSLACALCVAGCGGGSGGTGSGAAPVGVFITDSFRDDYKQVWGTIYKIEILDSSNTAKVIYDSPTGKTLNFSGLRDSGGARYAFLNEVLILGGAYTKFRLTLSKGVSIVPSDSNAAQQREFKGDATADPTKITLMINFSGPKSFASGDQFVVDFDLANFSFDGPKVVPSIKDGGKTGIDDLDRHEEDDVSGSISSITGTAPNQTFDLSFGENNRILKVRINSTTSIFNGNGTANPALTVGKRVEVTGKFDVVTKEIVASSVKIEDPNDDSEDSDQIYGSAVKTSVNLTTKSFDVNINRIEGFTTPGTLINVNTTAQCFFRNGNGVKITESEFYADVAANSRNIEVEGTFSGTTNKFTAVKAKIKNPEDNSGNGNLIEARGPVNSFDTENGTVLFTVQEFEGWAFGGGSIEATTTSTTTYRDLAGDEINKQTFFADLSGKTVKVEGTLINAKIQAKYIRYRNP